MFNSGAVGFGNDSSYSQFGAGGFVPSPGPDAGRGSLSAKKVSNALTLRAVTVKQIAQAVQEASDNAFMIDGEPLHNLTVVGRIIAVKDCPAFLEFLINDGTGDIDTKYYLDADDESTVGMRQNFNTNSYVRVYGSLRPMADQCPLVAFNVRVITDYDEHSHFMRANGPRQGVPGAPYSGMKEPKMEPTLNAASNGSPKETVLSVFKNANSELNCQQVTEALNGSFSYQQVQNIITNLSNEGNLYSTRDDYYAAC